MLFSKEEYKNRLKRVKKSMQEKGIELLISQDTNNMNYLTGYDAWSFYYAQCVIVNINADEPLCFVRAQDAGGAYIKTYLKNENIIVYDEKYIHVWPIHPYDRLVELIKEKKWDKLNIGVEMDSHYYTAYSHQKLLNGLPNAKIKDCERLVNWARLVKSDSEIKYMKIASQITQLGMKTAFDEINPGVRQCDAVAKIYSTLISGTKEYGGVRLTRCNFGKNKNSYGKKKFQIDTVNINLTKTSRQNICNNFDIGGSVMNPKFMHLMIDFKGLFDHVSKNANFTKIHGFITFNVIIVEPDTGSTVLNQQINVMSLMNKNQKVRYVFNFEPVNIPEKNRYDVFIQIIDKEFFSTGFTKMTIQRIGYRFFGGKR